MNPILEDHIRNMSDIHQHLTTLYMLTVEFDTKRVLELGTHTGESTIALLSAAREIDGHVTSVDIVDCPVARGRVGQYGFQDRWSFVQKDDMLLDWSEPIDHLFIDSSHSFDHTFKELEKFVPFVIKGGIITMHDITVGNKDYKHRGEFSGLGPMPNETMLGDVGNAIEKYFNGKKDFHIYKYYNNNGFAVIRKLS